MEINPGDRIRVKTRFHTDTGKVQSAHNYGRDGQDDWYIEYISDVYGACYVKQVLDRVISVEKI